MNEFLDFVAQWWFYLCCCAPLCAAAVLFGVITAASDSWRESSNRFGGNK